MYIPPNSNNLSSIKDIPQIRLGIQGYPGTGKTWAALTFPNPLVLNLDRGLGAHVGRPDVHEIPFYSSEYCKTIKTPYLPTDLKDVLHMWIDKEGKKLEPDQTLIVDGLTGIQNAYHKWYTVNQVYTKQGKVDDFAEWNLKKVFLSEFIEYFKYIKCHVVFIAHEADKKEKDGTYAGKVRPLLTGQFGDELVSHFTDWFRSHVADKPTVEVPETKLKDFGMTKDEYAKWCATFPRNTMYYWQTEGDSVFDGKCSSLINFPKFIPASFGVFSKYRRK